MLNSVARATRITFAALVAAGIALTAACDAASTDNRDEPGILVSGVDTAQVDLPQNVAAGEEFTITITTFGNACTHDVAFTRAEVQDHIAQVRPYDHSNGESNCAAAPVSIVHKATMRILERGVTSVFIFGAGPPTAESEGKPAIVRLIKYINVQ